MPYITNALRENVRKRGALTPGELNYEITAILNVYLHAKGENYSTVNDIMGALEGAKMEFYRRVVCPYEDLKRAINGDVYAKE